MTRPKILLIATGGTIGMTDAAAGGGAVPSVGASSLAAANEEIEFVSRDLFAKGSTSISLQDVARIAAVVGEAEAAGMAGVVVTHGTDTLAETAFALALMRTGSIPVVLTGAMRHAGQPGADGPANVAAAIAAAADPVARIGEPLVVFGDEIHLASLVRKAHGSRLNAFSSAPLGPVGWVKEGRATIPLLPSHALPHLALGQTVPPVAMLLVGSDLEPETVAAFIDAPVAGVVLAGAGGGHAGARSLDALSDLAARKPVILASRTEGGILTHTYGYPGGEIDLIARGLIPGGRWRPEQARIMLQLLLSAGADRDAIMACLTS